MIKRLYQDITHFNITKASGVKLALYPLFCVLVSSLVGCALLKYPKAPSAESDKSIVQGVPPDSLVRTPIEPYSGKHPADIKRPADTFEYPVQIGQLGPLEPMFSSAHEYPFLCQTEESGLGQPVVDNQLGYGVPVYEVDQNGTKNVNKVVGYSKDCQLKTDAYYIYNRVGTKLFFPLEEANGDIAKYTVNGELKDFILRVETGTINRFIYLIVAPRGENELIQQPNGQHWNRKLIFQFAGGVGIGRRQGKSRLSRLLKRRYDQLLDGYAVVFSSAHQTSNNYHIGRQEEVALRLKSQFKSLYGEPLYTVGIGGSGGGIQQYLLAQNNPDIIDAAIPQYSYPDMVTQTIHALDCDLLEFYFDITARDDRTWDKWHQRTWIQGTSGKNISDHDYDKLYRWSKLVHGYFPTKPRGITECVLGWRGPSQVAHNPRFTHRYTRYDKSFRDQVHWTHWEDLKDFYGVGEDGFAYSLWDNEGVQYGLTAMIEGKISIEQFLDLNARIGSWKSQADMKPVEFWRYGNDSAKLRDISIWSQHNMHLASNKNDIAPRSRANTKAIEGAYRSGMVFLGKIDIPIIDIRHYLDLEQDMHHSFATFSARQRMIDAKGHANNQVVWMAHKAFDPTPLAFKRIDDWMAQVLKHPAEPVENVRPKDLNHQCFDKQGGVIAAGESVWQGGWKPRSPDANTDYSVKDEGECLKIYPNFKSSRQVAGGSIRDNIFKCDLQTVDMAIKKGMYKQIDIIPHVKKLKAIFPTGVCDYEKAGQGTLTHEIIKSR